MPRKVKGFDYPQFAESLREKFVFLSGFHIFNTSLGDVAVLSVNSFPELIKALAENPERLPAFLLTPELILSSGMDSIPSNRHYIEDALESFKLYTTSYTATTFIVGSPYFEGNKVFNAAIVIKGGEIVSVIKKKSFAVEYEQLNFDLYYGINTLIDENIAIAICSDIVYSPLFVKEDPSRYKELFLKQGKSEIVESYVAGTAISNKAEVLFVLNAWGVGSQMIKFMQIEDIDMYYYQQIVSTVFNIFKNYPNLREIVICDRVVDEEEDASKTPFNTYLKRGDFGL